MPANLLSVTQAALKKQVSRNAIYRAIGDKRLKSSIVMGRFAIHEDDLKAWHPKPGPPKGQKVREEVKGRISASQKLRWAELKKNAAKKPQP